MAKSSGPKFKVTTGSFDREVCELVGQLIPHRLSKALGTDAVGLYRDDDLVILRNASGPKAERTWKKEIQIF